MLPYLLDFHAFGTHVKVPAYGVMLALAFTAAYIDGLRRAFKLGEDPKHIENLFLITIVASILGSRGFHVVIEEPGYYWRNPGKIVAVWEGGYVFYGAMLSAIAAIFIYCRRKKVAYLQFADIAAPATALGLFVGRLGCFLAGCCWGKACDLPWAARFTHPETFNGARGLPVHPTQLYESFAALGIYLVLNRRFRNRERQGQIFFEGILVYSVVRFIIEFWRGDEMRGSALFGWVSTSQLISLLLFPAALFGLSWLRKQPSP